ncbi:MAG: hypothetical protein IPK88_20205 [Saprospiraceae bacterium]|nr:hypothetical protein [Candidatus Defluviibacterium haderslevense]
MNAIANAIICISTTIDNIVLGKKSAHTKEMNPYQKAKFSLICKKFRIKTNTNAKKTHLSDLILRVNTEKTITIKFKYRHLDQMSFGVIAGAN